MSFHGISNYPTPPNEPVLGYLPGSSERAQLKSTLAEMAARPIDMPLFIGGKEVRTGQTAKIHSPHKHSLHLGEYHLGTGEHMAQAIAAALAARASWANLPWEARAAVFLKAAELLAGPYRMKMNAATMLGQSKTVIQAELDAACEMVDFFRWNVHFLRRLFESEQPVNGPQLWNRVELRPLEGFVLAISPFNFTSIAANLCTAPALLGNAVVWKPAPSAMYSAQVILDLLREAGLPDGVINVVNGPAEELGEVALSHRNLAGIHFTGSTGVFQHLVRTVGQRIDRYATYPRLVGETGGKDFIVAHESADDEALITAIVRGGYEYQGQKCSAASRVYLPAATFARIKDRLIGEIDGLTMGDVTDFRNFMGAVIDKRAFASIRGHIQAAKEAPAGRILTGGQCDDREGYFIRPTLVEVQDPQHRLMCQEVFGPVVAVHVFGNGEAEYQKALALVDGTSPYALTGAVFARERYAIEAALLRLRDSAGNFYINDKPTGAVVGQQPFGGARASGTNDKAGSAGNLLRWASCRTVKENFVSPKNHRYGYMAEE